MDISIQNFIKDNNKKWIYEMKTEAANICRQMEMEIENGKCNL